MEADLVPYQTRMAPQLPTLEKTWVGLLALLCLPRFVGVLGPRLFCAILHDIIINWRQTIGGDC